MTDSTDPAASSSSRARAQSQTTRQSALGAPPRHQAPCQQKRKYPRPCPRRLPRRARAPPRTRLQPKARSSCNGRARRAGGVANPLAEMAMPPECGLAGGPRSHNFGRRGAQPRSASRFATISFLWCVHTGHGSPPYQRGIEPGR